MQIAEVIGRVTLSKWHPEFTGATWLVATPLQAAGLRGDASGRGEPHVVYDELGASDGSRIGVSDGAEAAAPFHPKAVPLDAYNSAIFDAIEVREKRTAEGRQPMKPRPTRKR